MDLEIEDDSHSYKANGIPVHNTINIPNKFPYEDFKQVYLDAQATGTIKGVTTYRTGTSATVLAAVGEEEENTLKIKRVKAPSRPKELPCDIHHLTVKGEQWVVLVGLLEGEPFEIFAFKKKNIKIATKYTKGRIIKIKSGKYNLDIDGFEFEDIGDLFEREEGEAFTRSISASLRHGIDITYLVETLNKSPEAIIEFSKAMARTLKKYITDGSISSDDCPNCGGKGTLIYGEGCVKCRECDFGKC